jgi:hypothetical protein
VEHQGSAWTSRALALRRGFPRTYHFAQAARSLRLPRSDAARSSTLQPRSRSGSCLKALQDEFEFQWEFWLDDAPSWEPFFLDIEAIGRGSLLDALRKFQLLPDEVLEVLSRIKRPSEGRAVQSAQIFEPDHFHLALWALRASATNTRFTAHPARYWQAHRLDAQIWAGFRVSANTNKITF